MGLRYHRALQRLRDFLFVRGGLVALATLVVYIWVAPAHIVDTVGAGDAFSAVFLFGQAQGWSLPLTLARANAFAGAICGISGAVPADVAFYQPWIACWRSGGVLPSKAGAVV